MRCTRCDRPAIPQAVGQTPEGLVVFGWCVRCLEETQCRRIVVSRRRRSARSLWKRARQWRPTARGPERPGAHPLDDRRRVVGAVALILSVWGLVLVAAGWVLGRRHAPGPVSPLGNGTPAMLVAGGGATVVVALALWAFASGRAFVRARLALKAVRVASLVVAAVTLLVGILHRSTRRDTLTVGLASAAVAISVSAWWIEVRFHGPEAARGRSE